MFVASMWADIYIYMTKPVVCQQQGSYNTQDHHDAPATRIPLGFHSGSSGSIEGSHGDYFWVLQPEFPKIGADLCLKKDWEPDSRSG